MNADTLSRLQALNVLAKLPPPDAESTKTARAAWKRAVRGSKPGASIYARANAAGALVQPCTPTRHVRLRDLIATHLPRRGARSPKAAQRAYAMAQEARRQAADRARLAAAKRERTGGAEPAPRKGGAR